jgi:TRAP-type C4-dicarboxylate transport system substrate-binding protein
MFIRAKKLALGGISALLLMAGSAQALTLKLATDSGAKGSPAGNAIEAWATAIEDGSKGDIDVQVFYQNELGGQQEVFDLLVAGDVDIMLNWPMTSYDKRISVVYAPYMTFSWDEALAAYKPGGWINGMLDGIYEDMGLKFFGAWPEGFNGVATKGRYAKTVEDAKGLKVRVPPVFPMAETMQALGYQTATIDWGEVFTSIQTGIVDGDSANVIYWDYEYFRDTLDYYTRTKHQFLTGMLSMNLQKWQALSPDQQKLVEASAVGVMEKQFIDARVTDESYVAKAKEAGMEYIEPSNDEIKALAKTVRDTIWPLMEAEVGPEIMKTIRSNAPAL